MSLNHNWKFVNKLEYISEAKHRIMLNNIFICPPLGSYMYFNRIKSFDFIKNPKTKIYVLGGDDNCNGQTTFANEYIDKKYYVFNPILIFSELEDEDNEEDKKQKNKKKFVMLLLGLKWCEKYEGQYSDIYFTDTTLICIGKDISDIFLYGITSKQREMLYL